MKRRDLIRLFVKVFGLIILARAVIALPWAIYEFSAWINAVNVQNAIRTWQAAAMLGISDFGPLAIQAALGLCLLLWSGRVVDRASLAPHDDDVVEAKDLRNIEVILIAVLGSYFIASGLADLCGWSFRRGLDFSLGGFGYNQSFSYWVSALYWDIPSLMAAMVKLIIGILFVLGRGGSMAMQHRVHAWVRKWRTWPN